jgi:hypothetical protein
MKKLMVAMLGLSLLSGVTTVVFAADNTPKKEEKKKKVKKVKKDKKTPEKKEG